MGAPALNLAAWDGTSVEDVVKRVLAGKLLYTRSSFAATISGSIAWHGLSLRDEADAADVMQEAYIRAYQHLNQFAGEAKFSTWLTKIGVYEALGRVKLRGRTTDLDRFRIRTARHAHIYTKPRDPEQQAYDQELRLVLERSIEAPP